MRWRECARAVAQGVCEEELVGPAVLGVAATAVLHADETKRLDLTDGRGNGVVVNAVVHEVHFRDRQIAILCAAVVGVLDLQTIENAAAGKGKDTPCRTFEHLSQAPNPLAIEAISALAHAAASLALA
jgi:hypothetical protein